MIRVKKNEDEYIFVVQSKTGRELLHSIPFTSKKEIKDTLKHLCESQPEAQKIERRTNFDGKFLFDLKDTAGKTIGQSGLYGSEAGMENGIKNFQGSLAQVKDLPQL